MSIRGSITEVSVQVTRRSTEPRIEFVEGSRPPRVRKMSFESYLYGRVFVGDEIIRLNDEEITTADDFYRIVGVSIRELEKLRIQVRRDTFYRITIRKLEGEYQGKDEWELFDFEIKWRRGGMPLGVNMREVEDNVTICGTEAGSIADGNFHYGDVITRVNGKKVDDTKSVKAAILEGINNNNLTIRVARPIPKVSSDSLPADVTKIIQKNMNFHRHNHKYSAAITSAERDAPTSFIGRITGRGGSSQRSSRRSSPEVSARVTIQRPSKGDVKDIPTDTTADLKRTPPRPGSQPDDS
uniref:PDZ domain-containing protein n=1 Tax=Meloidogyne incognita TaxID=6306 RepID=A0A914KUU7_MELIC